VNWISDADEVHTTSGYVFLFGGGAVSWKSYKQTILRRSTMGEKLTILTPPALRSSGFVNSL